MSDFSATDVAFTGFGFARQHLRTMGIWAGVQLLVTIVLGALMLTLLGPAMADLQGLGQGARTDPLQALAAVRRLMPFYGLMILFALAFYPILYAAMNRAVLQPEDDRFGYLRLGADEGRQLLLMLLWIVVGIGLELCLGIVIAVPSLLFALVARPFTGVGVAFGCVVGVGGLIYIVVRLSLGSALTFERERVDLFGSWALTRDKFWKMFGAYVLAFVMAFIIGIIGGIFSVALSAAAGGGIGLSTMFVRPPVTTMAGLFALPSLFGMLISALITPLTWALIMMPAPAIYRHLSGATDPALDPATFD